MGVKLIETGRNKGRYIIDWRDRNGQRLQEMEGYNYRAACDILHKKITARAEKRELSVKPGDTLTFSELARLYVVEMTGKKASLSTDEMRIRHLAPMLGRRKIGEISRDLISKYAAGRLEKVQGATVNKEVGILRRVLNFGIKTERLEKNPASGWEKYPENPPPARVVQWGEYRQLLATAQEFLDKAVGQAINGRLHYNHFRYMIPIAFECGARRQEVVALKWEDVDFHTGQLRFWYRKGKKRSLKSRWVPMTDYVRDLLKGLSQNPDTPYLFPDRYGKYWKAVISFYRLWDRIAEAAGMPGLHFHWLRHSYCSHLANNQVGSDTRMELMGHTDPKTQMVYTHIANETKRRAAEVLNRLGAESILVGNTGGSKAGVEKGPCADIAKSVDK